MERVLLMWITTIATIRWRQHVLSLPIVRLIMRMRIRPVWEEALCRRCRRRGMGIIRMGVEVQVAGQEEEHCLHNPSLSLSLGRTRTPSLIITRLHHRRCILIISNSNNFSPSPSNKGSMHLPGHIQGMEGMRPHLGLGMQVPAIHGVLRRFHLQVPAGHLVEAERGMRTAVKARARAIRLRRVLELVQAQMEEV